ncbi:MAG TPA: hypothetical protein VEZ90_05840, partial [Blastocatellia bacterium]|nr:hypothetical protein [Blastocatellia bacterium]
EKALAIFRRYQVPFDEAESLYCWGKALNASRDYARANEKFDAATAIYRRCGGGEQWIDRIEAARVPASALTAPSASAEPATVGQGEALFRREGDYWTLFYGGKTSRLKDAKGLRYLAHLLAHPAEEIRAFELVALTGAAGAEEIETARATDLSRSHSITTDLGDAGEVLDEKARDSYKRRLTILQEELEEARELGDEARIERAEDEIQSLGRELKSAIGLSGRARRAASPRERARIAVTQAIRLALGKIAQNDPDLSKLLRSTIKTGNACSYIPAEASPVRWLL